MLQLIGGKRAATGDADQVGGDDGGHRQRRQALAHGRISCNLPSTVWVSVIQQ
jgi:hypothetical protein